MGKKNRFLEGVFLGALVGGAFTLLDKETRKMVFDTSKEVIGKTSKVLRDPSMVTEKIRKSVDEFTTTYKQIKEDIAFVTEKANELKETTPQMIEIFKDTKATLTNNNKN